jgi:hypothetical protein
MSSIQMNFMLPSIYRLRDLTAKLANWLELKVKTLVERLRIGSTLHPTIHGFSQPF